MLATVCPKSSGSSLTVSGLSLSISGVIAAVLANRPMIRCRTVAEELVSCVNAALANDAWVQLIIYASGRGDTDPSRVVMASFRGVPSSKVHSGRATKLIMYGLPVAARAWASPMASLQAGNVAASRQSTPASASRSACQR